MFKKINNNIVPKEANEFIRWFGVEAEKAEAKAVSKDVSQKEAEVVTSNVKKPAPTL